MSSILEHHEPPQSTDLNDSEEATTQNYTSTVQTEVAQSPDATSPNPNPNPEKAQVSKITPGHQDNIIMGNPPPPASSSKTIYPPDNSPPPTRTSKDCNSTKTQTSHPTPQSLAHAVGQAARARMAEIMAEPTSSQSNSEQQDSGKFSHTRGRGLARGSRRGGRRGGGGSGGGRNRGHTFPSRSNYYHAQGSESDQLASATSPFAAGFGTYREKGGDARDKGKEMSTPESREARYYAKHPEEQRPTITHITSSSSSSSRYLLSKPGVFNGKRPFIEKDVEADEAAMRSEKVEKEGEKEAGVPDGDPLGLGLGEVGERAGIERMGKGGENHGHDNGLLD